MRGHSIDHVLNSLTRVSCETPRMRSKNNRYFQYEALNEIFSGISILIKISFAIFDLLRPLKERVKDTSVGKGNLVPRA